MSEFSITFEEVASISKKLRTHADKMRNILEDVTSKINSVHADAWQSAAATSHLDEYNALKTKYQSFYGEIIKCADFLDETVEASKQTDTSIQNATSN